VVRLPGALEQLRILFATPGSPSIALELVPRNRAYVYVRSGLKEDRGRTLLRVENLRLIDNPALLVGTFEWTLEAVWQLGRSGDPALLCAIEQRWRGISARIVP
jgi:hypothetical protein